MTNSILDRVFPSLSFIGATGYAGTVRLILLIGVLLPACLGIINLSDRSLSMMARVGDSALIVEAAIFLLLSGICLRYATSWPERYPSWVFVVLAIVIFGALKVYFVSLIDKDPVSDFRSMWNQAGGLAENGFRVPPDGASWPYRIHFERIVLYLYPLRALFGNSNMVFELANVTFVLLSSLAVYWLGSNIFGSKVARVALVVSLLAVEPTYAALIPTHDIPGAFYTLLAILFLTISLRSVDRRSKAIAMAVAAGVMFAVMDLQRTTGVIASLTLLILLVGYCVMWVQQRFVESSSRNVEENVTGFRPVCVLLALVSMQVAGFAFQQIGFSVAPADMEERVQLKAAAFTESWGTGSYGYWRENWNRISLPKERPSEFVAKKVVSDLVWNPVERVGNYLRKSMRLYTMGEQSNFYLYKAEFRGETLLKSERLKTYRIISQVFSISFLVLIVFYGYRKIMTAEILKLEHVPLLFIGIFSFVMIVSAEVQPRYMFPMWFIGALYVASEFVRCFGKSERRSMGSSN